MTEFAAYRYVIISPRVVHPFAALKRNGTGPSFPFKAEKNAALGHCRPSAVMVLDYLHLLETLTQSLLLSILIFPKKRFLGYVCRGARSFRRLIVLAAVFCYSQDLTNRNLKVGQPDPNLPA